ncbi:MAG: ATP-binding protein [Luteibaculaceae bacterium]
MKNQNVILIFHGFLYLCTMFGRILNTEIIDALSSFPAIGLLGPRQVGKTALVKQLMQQLSKPCLYLDLENPRDKAKLSDSVLFFEAHQESCIILDEVQLDKSLFPVLRSMIDAHRVPARFILLGSASPELIRSSSESLAGRIHYFELTPLVWSEVGSTITQNQLWLRGGFPDSLLARSEKSSLQWRKSFIKTYIERDLPMLGLNTNPEQLARLWRMLAHINGSLLSYENLSKSLGVTGPSVKRYIHFLKEAFLVRLLEPYSLNVKKRLVKSPKIYVRDSGLTHQMLDIETYDALISHPICGFSWEGFAVEQIAAKLQDQYDLSFYRTQQGAEIDLVLSKGNKPKIGIEFKFSSAPKITQGTKIAKEDLALEQVFVVTPETDYFPLSNDIFACSLPYLLEKILP